MSKKNNKNQHELIEELVAARKMRKLTQEELASIVCCPQSSIARIENGTVSPTLDTLQKLCDALEIDIFFRKRKK